MCGKLTPDEPGGVAVIFTRGGVFPWEEVSREEYLRALIAEAEGTRGEKLAEARKAFQKTPYEEWLEGAAQRKKDRDDLAVQLKGIKSPEEIAKTIAEMEASERQVTGQLQARDAEDRQRNEAALAAAPAYGDGLRAQIAAMAPEERARLAMVEKNGALLPLDAGRGSRVLRPKLELWRVRQSPVEIHSIAVSIGGSTGLDKSRDAVINALWQTYRKLDWAALKRMVDASP